MSAMKCLRGLSGEALPSWVLLPRKEPDGELLRTTSRRCCRSMQKMISLGTQKRMEVMFEEDMFDLFKFDLDEGFIKMFKFKGAVS